ncbi:MAG: 4-hydroxybenzoate octaprenyltransferase [Alphaproteobacteria bacterium]|nr:4-hydroxybenzoate octaprenyltransferase [Alphaproteobacteria bacterium]
MVDIGQIAGLRMRVRTFVESIVNPQSPINPYVRLMRADKPTGTWLLLLPCWWGVAFSATYFPNLWLMFLFAVGAIIMRGAGCVVNDIYDRKLDCMVARTQQRPLASGEIALPQAILFLLGLLALGLGVLFLFNTATIILGALSLALVFTYPLMKRITWWPQFFLGLAFNWGALLGGTAVMGRVDSTHLLVYTGGIFWTLAYDTIYAHQDKRDDIKVGIKSTALLLGGNSLRWISLFYTITIGCLFLAGMAHPDGMGRIYTWGILAAACFAAMQLSLWNPDDPGNCWRRFTANRDFGLIVLAAIVAGRIFN